MIKPEQCERLTRKARKTLEEEYGLGAVADLVLDAGRWGIRLMCPRRMNIAEQEIRELADILICRMIWNGRLRRTGCQ